MRGIAICIVLAACSFPEKHGGAPGDGRSADSNNGIDGPAIDGRTGVDAPAGGPFGCIGQPFPTTAPAQILFQGSTIGDSLQNPNMLPVPGAPVRVYSQVNGQQYVGTVTDANGNFTGTAQTNGMAIDGFLEIDAPPGQQYVPTYLYPRQPFHGDQLNLQVAMYDQTTIAQIYQVSGVPYDSQSMTLFAQIVDCNGAPVANAKLIPGAGSLPPRGIRYLVNGQVDPAATATDGSGTVIALGILQNNVAFSATTTIGQFHTYHYLYAPQAVLYASIQP